MHQEIESRGRHGTSLFQSIRNFWSQVPGEKIKALKCNSFLIVLLTFNIRFQNKFLEYTKGTGDYNKFRRGYLEGYMVIHNITDAEAGLYECVVDTTVGTIYASSDVFVHGPPGLFQIITILKKKVNVTLSKILLANLRTTWGCICSFANVNIGYDCMD